MNNKVVAKSPVLTAITKGDLVDVAQFLHLHMNNKVTPKKWHQGIGKTWLKKVPNYGFMLQLDTEIVGVLCALYSEQYVAGKTTHFCNPHSWCVLPAFRKKSMDLVLAVIRQKCFNFTMLTPNSEGIVIFKYLRFKPLGNRVTILLNLPSASWRKRVMTIKDASTAQRILPKSAAKYFIDHMEFYWLNFLFFGAGNKYGFIIFKVGKYKRLPCAVIMYVSDSPLFRQYWPAIRTYLLFKHGLVSSKIESRLLDQPIHTWIKPEQGHQKFFLSTDLSADCISNIYSELVALNL